jgi:hypothetical protein
MHLWSSTGGRRAIRAAWRESLESLESLRAKEKRHLFAVLICAMRAKRRPGKTNPENAALESVFRAMGFPQSAEAFNAVQRREKSTKRRAINR